jgi:hypothetical protein
VEAFSAPKEEIFTMQHFNIELQTRLVGAKIGITKQNIDIEPLISM